MSENTGINIELQNIEKQPEVTPETPVTENITIEVNEEPTITQPEVIPETPVTENITIEVNEEPTITQQPENIPDDIQFLDERGLGEDLLFNPNKVPISPDEIKAEAVVAVAAAGVGGLSVGAIAIIVVVVLSLGLGIGLTAGAAVGVGLGVGLNACVKPDVVKSQYLPSTPICLDQNSVSFKDGILGYKFNIYVAKDGSITYPTLKVYREGNYLRDVNITDSVTGLCSSTSSCQKLNYTFTPDFFSFSSSPISNVRYDVTNFQKCIAPQTGSLNLIGFTPTVLNYTDFCISTTVGDPFYTVQTNISGSGFYQTIGDTSTIGTFTIGGFPYSIVNQYGCTTQGNYQFCNIITVSINGQNYQPYQYLNYKITYQSTCQSNNTIWAPSYPIINQQNSPPICYTSQGSTSQITVTGSGFFPKTNIYLINNGIETQALSTVYQDTNTMLVTFPANLPSGSYALGGSNFACSKSYPSVTLTYLPLSQITAIEPRVMHSSLTQQFDIFLSGNQYLPLSVTVRLQGGNSIPITLNSVINNNYIQATITENLLTPGTYSVTVANANGCLTTSSTVTIVVANSGFTFTSISPSFALQNVSTRITLTGASFTGFPSVYLKQSDGTGIPLFGAEVLSSTTLSFSVPPGINTGSYPIYIVGQYSGAIASPAGVLTITTTPYPTISSVYPSTYISSTSTTAYINGTNFNNPTVSLDCGDLTSTTTMTLSTTVSYWTSNTIVATFPTNPITIATCNVIVTNSNSMAVTYTGVAYRGVYGTGPQSVTLNLRTDVTMNDTLYDFGLTISTVTATNTKIMVVTGGTNSSIQYVSTTSYTQLDKYGRIASPFIQGVSLPYPLARHKSYSIGRAIFVIGGLNSTGTSNSIYRSTFVDTQIYPSVISATRTYVGTGGLPAGYYYYRISANYDPNDSEYPGGETYAGDVFRAGYGVSVYTVTFTWQSIPGAVSYNIYRTNANSPSSTMTLMKTVPSTQTSYTDSNSDPLTSTQQPLPLTPIMTQWVLFGQINTARSSFAFNIAPSFLNPYLRFLFVMGGDDGTGTRLSSIEFGSILVTPKASLETRDSQNLVAFNLSSLPLQSGTKDYVNSVILSSNNFGLINSNQYYVYVLPTSLNTNIDPISVDVNGVPTPQTQIGGIGNGGQNPSAYCGYSWINSGTTYVSALGGIVSGPTPYTAGSSDFALVTTTSIQGGGGSGVLTFGTTSNGIADHSCSYEIGLFYAMGGQYTNKKGVTSVYNTIYWTVL